ncbi:uncharacterized protein LOC143225684 isoform X2 [Tachypleus tridentatus]|uniref:uncharacterized protein LOC143225684 isoform X2 n=1 Tax=Tachypleus tridentatus TaxID=6853 RepID=UPI003FD3BD85
MWGRGGKQLLSNSPKQEEAMKVTYKNRTKEDKYLYTHRIHHNSRGFQDTEKSHHFVNFNSNRPNDYKQSHASHLKDGNDYNDYAVSLCDRKITLKDGITKSDLILNDSSSSPFLINRTLKSYVHDIDDETDISDDCNNNNKSNINYNCGQDDDLEHKDALFSDIPSSTKDFVLEHSEINNNNAYFQTYFQRELIKLDERPFKKISVNQLHNDPVIQEWGIVCTQAGQQSCKYTNIRNHISEHFLFFKTESSDSVSSKDLDVSPVNETSSSSALDVNMTMEMLNNFSMPTSQHNSNQCLVNKDEKTKNANIHQLESASTCLEEDKILNLAPNPPRNMTDEYQEELKNKHKVEVIFSVGEVEKCELDSAEKEIRKKECNTDLRSQENSSVDENMKIVKPSAPIVDYLIEPLLKGSPIICENVSGFVSKSCISDAKIENKNWSWSSGENSEHLLKIIDTLPVSLATKNEEQNTSIETAICSRNNCDKQVPPKVSGTNSKSADSIKHFQMKRPIESADTSSFRHESTRKERSSLWNYNGKKSLFSDDSLNNTSITNSAVYKSMAEKVTLTPPCVSFPTTRSNSLPGKDTSIYSYPIKKDNSSPEVLGDFDVYNIETTMPKIDWIAMEEHLTRAAKEADWYLRRRNDREEIRRKLAMESDGEDYYCGERVTRKPSLSTRLQSGMNLQICFMNERASDQEIQGSDHDLEIYFQKENISSAVENRSKLIIASDKTKAVSNTTLTESTNSSQSSVSKRQRPSVFFNRPKSWSLQSTQANSRRKEKEEEQEDFVTRQARLQAEARIALAQAKEMARMQMEVERQRKKKSPIADIVGFILPDGRHRLSRQILTDMNVAQLQVIVNDLHTQIENLNEELVQLLLERDDLNMQQDSMLVDIEDLTRYLAKNDALRNRGSTEQVDSVKTTTK